MKEGNHRITTAIDEGYTHLPVAVFLIKDNLIHEGNGLHFVDAKEIVKWEKIKNWVKKEQINPTLILDNSLFSN